MYYAATDEILADLRDEFELEPAEASGILDCLLEASDYDEAEPDA